MRAPFACLALLLATPAFAQPDTGDAEYVARLFCQQRGAYDETALAPHLSPALTALIAEAWAANAAFEAANPGDKPPLGDGIPWQSWPDHAPLCLAKPPVYMMEDAVIHIHYRFLDEPRLSWHDQLILVLVDGNWLINDVSFDTGGRLTDILAAIAAKGDG